MSGIAVVGAVMLLLIFATVGGQILIIVAQVAFSVASALFALATYVVVNLIRGAAWVLGAWADRRAIARRGRS